MTRPLPRSALVLAVAAALALPAFADDGHPHAARDEARTLDEVKVTASPLDTPLSQLVRPAAVLSGVALDERRATTLGDTLSSLPGVQSRSFGPGVGRPIIRGFDGSRVQVLANGLSALDVSTVSADHAVSIEPFLADSIEVLKGPANLFFGSGAIGGAVNVVDNRIPTERAERFISGRAEVRGSTGNGEGTTVLRLDGGVDKLAWHLDGLIRETGDIEIPGFAYSADERAEEIADGESADDFERGTVGNTDISTNATSGGVAWLGDRFFWGASLSNFNTDYGIPSGAHAHAHGHSHGHGAKGEKEEEEENVRIDLSQSRTEARFGVNDLGPLQQISLRATRNEYEHTEIKGFVPETQFLNDAEEARLELVQVPVWGWSGALGLQYGHRDFEALGDEAFVPPSVTKDEGIFLLQERTFGAFKLELGARRDRIELNLLDGLAVRDFDATSGSIGLRFAPSDTWQFTANLDRAERAPTAEELFSEGAHVATGSYEIGDPLLDTERADRAELAVNFQSERFGAKAAIYRTEFRDFIYLADAGVEIDELPVLLWVQDDATFTGWEAEGTAVLADAASGKWTLRGFVDSVEAELDAGGNLPRIAPGRVGVDLGWTHDAWRSSVGVVNYQKQDNVAAGESATDGFTLVNAQVSYHWDTEVFGWEAYVQGSNLSDEEARLHTSFLKDYSPLMGRSFTGGLRVFF